MDFRLLGPVEAWNEAGPVMLGGPQQRRVLAALLSEAGRLVTYETLIDVLWPAGDAPETARRTAISYVSRLRSALGSAWITTTDAGYSIETAGASIDADRFVRLVQSARADTPHRQVETLDEALALWRGPAFGEMQDEWWARPTSRRLEELRFEALAARVDAISVDGWEGRALGEATALVAAHPLRSQFVAQLMRGLHAVGRTDESLQVFQTHRLLLVERTGLDPPAELVELDRSIAGGTTSMGASDGRLLRGYAIKDQIGEGAYGRVYRASQPAVRRDVAIKVIRPDIADDRRFVKRFEIEAQLVASVEHAHIVPLYDFWREPGAAYLVFRLLRGGSGGDLAGRPMSLVDATAVVDQIGGALAAAHAAHIVHRDVKPSNILFDDDRVAYLSDFGVATVLDGVPGFEHGSSALLDGSSSYASPEQRAGAVVDSRSDQFGLATTLWFFLTGAVPDTSLSPIPSTSPVSASLLPPLTTQRADLPGELDAVLARATRADPAHRFGDVDEFVAAWHAAAATPPGRRPSHDAVNPFKGLRPFRTVDAAAFFGRSSELQQLAAWVDDHPVVAVVGPSGSGKSSLVLAGLIPRLRDEGFATVMMTPGSNPFDAMAVANAEIATTADAAATDETELRQPGGVARALATLGEGGRLAIVIDQLEELWTTSGEYDREQFTAALAEASSIGACKVITTIRADWYDRLLQDPHLGSLVARATFGIPPMSAEGLRQAIVAPVAPLGIEFEPELVGRLMSEVADQPGSLPLLQFVLAGLFDRRRAGVVTLASYEQIGGLSGAIAAQADQIVEALSPDQQGSVSELFARLVTVGEGTDDTRRRVRRSELAHVPDSVIVAFVDHRLLTIDRDHETREPEPTVEIAHESLLKMWPRLAAWLAVDRAWLREVRGLAGAATLWDASGRNAGELYRGARLAVVSELSATRAGSLTPLEAEFLAASQAQASAEQDEILARVAQQRRQNRRLRRSLVALAAVLVAALIAGAVAVDQRRRADQQTTVARQQSMLAQQQAALAEAGQQEAETQRVAASRSALDAETAADTAETAADEARAAARQTALENLVNGSLVLRDSQQDLAALLAIEAYRLDPSAKTRSGLLGSFTRDPSFMGYRRGDPEGDWFSDLVLVGDGSKAFALYRDDRLVTIDIASGSISDPLEPTLPRELEHASWLAVSGDGRFVVEASGADAYGSQQPAAFRVYDSVSGRSVTPPIPIGFTPGNVAISSDGSLVVVAGGRHAAVELYRVADGLLLGRYTAPYPEQFDYWIDTAKVTFGPDGSIYVGVLTGDVVVLDPATMQPVVTYSGLPGGTDAGVRVAADGSYLVAWGSLRVMRIDLPSGTLAWSIDGLGGRTGDPTYQFCSSFALNDVTGRFYCADGYGQLVEYDVVNAAATAHDFGTQLGNTASLAISGDGAQMVAASGNTTALAWWRLDGGGPIQRTVAVDYPNFVGGYDASGQYLIVGRPSGQPLPLELDRAVWDPELDRLVDPMDATPLATWSARPGELIGAFVDPDGVNSGLYDVASHSRTGHLHETLDLTASIPVPEAATRHAITFVKYPDDGQVRRFDIDGDEILPEFETEHSSQFASLTADGSVVVISSFFFGAAMFDAASGEQIGERSFELGGTVVSSQDVGVSSTIDGRLLLFDPKTLAVTGSLPSSGGAGQSLQFSDDGSMLMVKGGDQRVTLYDIESGIKLGDAIGGESLDAFDAALRPDGKRLAVPDGRSIVVWNLEPDVWATAACSLAGRNLTHAEWDRYIGELDEYHVTCPDLGGGPDG